ncbi:MAG: LysR family transcriptional regulator, nitrogen assimilation regulatory protein [Burkholderiales bacterium]
MELRQLKYFIAIIESGSFSKAAIESHVVQSALSQQIAALETELEVQLLVRSAQGVTPTTAGQLFYQHAQHLLRQVEHAKTLVRASDGKPSGRVTIGLPTSTAATLSLPLLEACLALYPGIQLHLMEGLSRQMHQALINGKADMVIQFSGQPEHGLRARRLLTEELFVVSANQANGPAPEVGAITLCGLRDMPLLLPERGNGLRDLVEAQLAALGVAVTPVAELGSLTTMIEAAEQGIGATLLPMGAFHRQYRAGTLRADRIENLSIMRGLMLCVSETLPLTEAAQALHGLIIRVVNDLVHQGVWKEAELAEDATNCR